MTNLCFNFPSKHLKKCYLNYKPFIPITLNLCMGKFMFTCCQRIWTERISQPEFPRGDLLIWLDQLPLSEGDCFLSLSVDKKMDEEHVPVFLQLFWNLQRGHLHASSSIIIGSPILFCFLMCRSNARFNDMFLQISFWLSEKKIQTPRKQPLYRLSHPCENQTRHKPDTEAVLQLSVPDPWAVGN